jgi:hypothetical protein
MKKNWFAFFTVVLFVGAIGLYYTFFVKSGELINVQSFEQCVAAGNAILESYPAQCQTKDGKLFTENIGNEIQMSDKIRITSPRPNHYLVSPVMITGEARGTWFFEATAPVKLIDEAGNVVAQGHITANPVQPTVDPKQIGKKGASDSAEATWMTTEFVPFTGELIFTAPATPKATLVLEKDNPSGLPQNDEKLSIPVYLK